MSKKIIQEIIKFLGDDRVDLRNTACLTVAQLTGTKDGLDMILQEDDLIVALVRLLNDGNEMVKKEAAKVLINISSEEVGSNAFLNVNEVDIVEIIVSCIRNPEYEQADLVGNILSNMSHFPDLCLQLFQRLAKSSLKLDGLVDMICQVKYNKKGASLDFLAKVLANLTQCKDVRIDILNSDKQFFQRLLSFIEYPDSVERRKMIVSVIHNCCFEKHFHEWMLSNDVELASRLVLPLAGPDAFTPEENDSLPLDLQYLGENKLREDCREIRALLLQSLIQLCATKRIREKLRETNVYLVLREHHKWEKDENCVLLNEDVVNFLIRTEDEIGEDDLSAVEVPEHLTEKFTNLDDELREPEVQKQ